MRQIDELVALRMATKHNAIGIWPLRQPSGSELNIVNNSYIPVSVGTGIERLTDPNDESHPYFFRFKRNASSVLGFGAKAIPLGSYTLKFSMRMSAKPTAENQEIISSAYARSSDAGIRIWADTSGQVCFSGCYKNSSNYSHMVYDYDFPFDNTWVDYLFSYNATTRVVTLWKNGKLHSTGAARSGNSISHTYNVVVGRQPDTSYARYFQGDMCDIEIYRTVLTPKDFIINPSFVKHNNVFKYFSDGQWKILPNEPTTEDYLQHGMLDTSPHLDRVGDISPIDQINGSFELHTWTNGSNVSVEIDKPTAGQNIVPTVDSLFVDIQSIDSLVVTGSPNAKVVFSIDGGVSWKTFKDSTWVDVGTFRDGMNLSEVSSINRESLRLLIGNPGKLRIGYFINPGEEIEGTTLKVTLMGPINFAPANSYDLSYEDGVITYNIKVNGNYFINYLDAM